MTTKSIQEQIDYTYTGGPLGEAIPPEVLQRRVLWEIALQLSILNSRKDPKKISADEPTSDSLKIVRCSEVVKYWRLSKTEDRSVVMAIAGILGV